MPILWIPAAITAAAGIATTIANNRARKKQAQRAREQALNDWNRVNEYNHPKSQRQRMEEAGYNPNNFYSQGTVGAAEQVEQTEPHANQFDPNVLANTGIAAYLGYQQHKAGLDKLREETESYRIANKERNAKYMAELQYYAENAKNNADRLFYEAQIARLKKQEEQGIQDVLSGEFQIVDGKVQLADQMITGKGAFKALELVNDINSKRDAQSLIQQNVENQRLANKSVKELDKMVTKLQKDGMSYQEALRAATWIILYRQIK